MAEEAKVKLTADDAGFLPVVERDDKAVKGLDESLDQLGQGDPLGPLGDSAEESARKVQDLERRLDEAKAAFDEADRRFRQGQLAEGFDEASEEAQELRRDVQRTGRAFTELATESASQLKKPVKALKAVQAATRRANRALEKFGKGKSLIAGLASAMGRLRTVTSALAGLALVNIGRDLARGLLGASTQALALQIRLQATNTALKETLGGSDAAARGMDFLEKTSGELRIQIGELSKNYVDLTAATKGTVVAGEETDALFRAVIESGKVLGTTNDAISRSFLGLSQLAGRGTFSLEELRQVTENLPGSMQAFADQLGVSQKELLALVSSGTLGAEALIDLRKALDSLAGEGVSADITDLRSAFDAASVGAERLSQTFGEELVPGVKAFASQAMEGADAANALAAAVGAQLSSELSNLAKLLGAVDSGLSATFEGFEGLEKLRFPDLAPGAAGINTFLDNLLGIPAAAAEAFAKLEQEAGNTAEAIAKSSLEALNAATADLELSAGKRREIEKALADDLAKINEATVDQRKALRRLETEAAKLSADERLAIEREIGEALKTIGEERAQSAEEAAQAQVEAARRAAKEEALITLERLGQFDQIAEAAKESAQKRLDTETEFSLKLKELERETAEKSDEIRKEFLADLADDSKEREKVEAELQQKLQDLALESEQKRRAILDRQLEAEKAVAEERIKLEEEVQERRRAAAEESAAILEQLRQATGGDGEESSPLAQAVDEVKESVQEYKEALKEAQEGTEATFGQDRSEEVLDLRDAVNEATLGISEYAGVAEDASIAQDELFGEGTENALALGEAVDAYRQSAEVARDVTVRLGEDGAESFLDLLASYKEVSEGQRVSQETLDEFQRQVETFIPKAGDAAGKTSEWAKAAKEAADATEEQRQQVDGAATAARALATEQESATATAEGFEGAAVDVSDAAESIGDSAATASGDVEELAAGLKSLLESANALPAALNSASTALAQFEGSAAGIDAAAAAARSLAAAMSQVTSETNAAADAAARLRDNVQQASDAAAGGTGGAGALTGSGSATGGLPPTPPLGGQ